MAEYARAALLPPDWDEIGPDNIYLKRDFLHFLEDVSDVTGERYYAVRDAAGRIDSKFMLYTRKKHALHLFSRRIIHVDVNFVYPPLSISRCGAVLGPIGRQAVFDFLRAPTGMTLVYNLPEDVSVAGFATSRTCPRCVLPLRWHSFEAYLGDMRSHYRARYIKALRKSAGLRLRFLDDNKKFTPEMYALYLQVYDNAVFKIEKLRLEFFQGPFFKIFVLEDAEGKPLGFIQLLENGKELIFEFVGFDHAMNRAHDLYIRMLLEIVRYGIEHGFESIDFGQTADEAKLKLGCRYEKICILGRHSNRLLNAVLKFSTRFQSMHYQALDDTRFKVFNT